MSGRGVLYIVSGNVGSGKTTFCTTVLDSLPKPLKDSWIVTGILSPGVFEGQEKIAIDALDIASAERRRLAQRRTDESEGVLTQRWSLDPRVIEWCNRVLRTATPCDMLIVDELGPLEFRRGEGFRQGITALDSGGYKLALAVVRTELLHFAEQRWPDARTLDITTRDHALASADDFIAKIASSGV